MKPHVALGILLCSAVPTASAQSFVDTSNTWNVVECYNLGSCQTLYYKFIGDTALSGHIYGKLYSSYSPDMSNASLAVLMREDSDHVVYGYQDTSEFVYYDMDMVVADSVTVTTNYCPWEITYMVYSLVTVELLNGEERRRWQLYDDWGWNDDWIEGIGSIYGPFSFETQHCTADLFWSLNCFTQNDTLKYQSPDFPTCDYNTTGITETYLMPVLHLSPNPFHDKFTVAGIGCTNAFIEMRDALGHAVLRQQADLSAGCLVDGSALPPGFYSVHCRCGAAQQDVVRVMKL